MKTVSKTNYLVVLIFLFTINFLSKTFAQNGVERVSFSIKNASLKGKYVEFKNFNNETKGRSGYGYGLNAMSNHAVNLPAPVRVYVQKNGKLELLFVVKKQDNGKQYDVNKTYDISREDYLEASYAELNEETAALKKADKDKSIEELAKEKNIPLVSFRLSGSSLFGKQVYVRYELPWDRANKNYGFSRTMNTVSNYKVTLPVGTKVFQCSDVYWEKDRKFTEKLIVTVDSEKQNYSYKLN